MPRFLGWCFFYAEDRYGATPSARRPPNESLHRTSARVYATYFKTAHHWR
jgi:hypothetical protein